MNTYRCPLGVWRDDYGAITWASSPEQVREQLDALDLRRRRLAAVLAVMESEETEIVYPELRSV